MVAMEIKTPPDQKEEEGPGGGEPDAGEHQVVKEMCEGTSFGSGEPTRWRRFSLAANVYTYSVFPTVCVSSATAPH